MNLMTEMVKAINRTASLQYEGSKGWRYVAEHMTDEQIRQTLVSAQAESIESALSVFNEIVRNFKGHA